MAKLGRRAGVLDVLLASKKDGFVVGEARLLTPWVGQVPLAGGSIPGASEDDLRAEVAQALASAGFTIYRERLDAPLEAPSINVWWRDNDNNEIARPRDADLWIAAVLAMRVYRACFVSNDGGKTWYVSVAEAGPQNEDVRVALTAKLQAKALPVYAVAS